MTWVKVAPGVEAAHHGSVVYVMSKAVSGMPNRWNLISMATKFAGAVFLGRELTPGRCRRLAIQDAGLK